MPASIVKFVPHILGALVGCLVAYWLNSQFSEAIAGGAGLDAAAFLVVSAPAIVILSIVVLMITGTSMVSSFVAAFSALVEIGIMVFGAQVLMMWYMTPDNPHLEPLFVTVGVALVGIEYGRSWVRTFEQAAFKYHGAAELPEDAQGEK